MNNSDTKNQVLTGSVGALDGSLGVVFIYAETIHNCIIHLINKTSNTFSPNDETRPTLAAAGVNTSEDIANEIIAFLKQA